MTNTIKSALSAMVCSAILAAGLTLTACSTMEGLGKDIKAAGNALEQKAKEIKEGDDE